MSTLERLLDELDETREQLLVALSELPEEALLVPGAIARYSVADVLVNLTIWEAELVTGLMRLEQNKKPAKLLDALNNRQASNQKWYEQNQGRELDLIFDDLQQVRVQLEGWLEAFSEKSLTDRKRYKWLNGRSLYQFIRQITLENEKKYVPLIGAFADKWLTETAVDPEEIEDEHTN